MDLYQDFFPPEMPVLETELNTGEFFDQNNLLSPLFENIPETNIETNSTALSFDNISCESNLNSVEPTAVSNTENMLSSSASLDSLHETNQQKNTLPNCKETKKSYKCDVCNRIFLRNYNLIRHQKSHIKEKLPEGGKKTFECDVCNRIFSRNCNLMQHQKSHIKEKLPKGIRNKILTYDCKDSKKTFECGVCNKIFSRNCHLLQHQKSHIKEKVPEDIANKILTCEICLKVFSSKAILNRHKLTHNMDGNRKYLCEFCNYAFTRKDLLCHHLRSYQNSTYTCTECNRKFCRKKELKNHTCGQKSMTSKIYNQNPYCEKVKDFKRKHELKEICTTTFENSENSSLDLKIFLKSLNTDVENEIKYNLYEKKELKCSFTLEAMVSCSDQNELSTFFLHSNVIIILSESMIRTCIESVFTEMIKQYLQLKDNWTLHKILKLEVVSVKL